MKPLSFREPAGLVFRYHTNRHFYQFALAAVTRAILRLRLPMETELRRAAWRTSARRSSPTYPRYTISVSSNEGGQDQAYIDDKLILDAVDSEFWRQGGRLGNLPCAIPGLRRYCADPEIAAIQSRIAARDC